MEAGALQMAQTGSQMQVCIGLQAEMFDQAVLICQADKLNPQLRHLTLYQDKLIDVA